MILIEFSLSIFLLYIKNILLNFFTYLTFHHQEIFARFYTLSVFINLGLLTVAIQLNQRFSLLAQ